MGSEMCIRDSYEEDGRVRAELIETTRQVLGERAHEEAMAEGRALGADAAADLASEVLARVGSRTPDRKAVS